MRSLGSAGNRAACGSHVTLSGFWLPFTAQQKEMLFATMETGDSLSLLSWHQVSLLWCPDRVGAALCWEYHVLFRDQAIVALFSWNLTF